MTRFWFLSRFCLNGEGKKEDEFQSLEVREASSSNLKMSDIRRFLPLKIVMSQFSDLVVIDFFLKMNCAYKFFVDIEVAILEYDLLLISTCGF